MGEDYEPNYSDDTKSSNKRTTIKLLAVVVFMFGFAYALVPLYDVLCEVTGLNGRTSTTAAQPINVVDTSRTITVQMLADADPAMPWDFKPETRSMKVHPGKINKINFYVRNNAFTEITGQAVPSISPGIAASHFKKTQCFCFDNQKLDAGAEMEMPVVFYIDPALPKHITTVTLSYTLFNISQKENIADNQSENEVRLATINASTEAAGF